MVLDACGVVIPEPAPVDVYFVGMGEDASALARKLTYQCRQAGLVAECDKMGRSTKAQFKYADKIGARFVGVIGSDELAKNCVNLKNMGASQQLEVNVSDVVSFLQNN